jgi:hypothetical protein
LIAILIEEVGLVADGLVWDAWGAKADVGMQSKANLVVFSGIGDSKVPQDCTLIRQRSAIKPGTDFSAGTG